MSVTIPGVEWAGIGLLTGQLVCKYWEQYVDRLYRKQFEFWSIFKEHSLIVSNK